MKFIRKHKEKISDIVKGEILSRLYGTGKIYNTHAGIIDVQFENHEELVRYQACDDSIIDYLIERAKKLDCILKRTCRKNETGKLVVHPSWVKDQEIEKELSRLLEIIKAAGVEVVE